MSGPAPEDALAARESTGALPPATTRRRICLVSYEIHPTTWGGCGMLLHHSAELLLQAGHDIVFLLDIPRSYFEKFRDQDRLGFPHPDHVLAYHVDELCADFEWGSGEAESPFLWKARRFDHALRALVQTERIDFVEFFEYCGVGYYALARKLYGLAYADNVLGIRVHNSIEWIDVHEATKPLTLDRYLLYGLERAALDLAEAVLVPTPTYADAYYHDEYHLDRHKTVVSQSPRRPFQPVDRSDPTIQNEIVYFGRVFQFKGVDRMLQAAVLLLERRPEADVRFVFIGQDTRETPVGDSHVAYLERQIPPALKDRIEFTGQLTHEQTAERFSRTLFGVFPNEFESFCYALHEMYHAGIPVVLKDLPGFADFFEHERNALVCDGSVQGLVEAMERMLDDPELRERLTLPYPVALEPLGEYYHEPVARAPLGKAGGPEGRAAPEALVVVLSRGDAAKRQVTLDALLAQEEAGDFRVVLLEESRDVEDAGFPFLGSLWQAFDLEHQALAFGALTTRDALCVLEAGDRPDPRFLALARGALGRRAGLAFAGTWWRSGTRIAPTTLDLAPEIFPYQMGPTPTRALVRTEAGRPLVDLFDCRLGPFGEIGHLWQAVERHGGGCLLPDPHLEVESLDPRPPDPIHLSFLVMTQTDPDRLRRLARYSSVVGQQDTSATPSRRAVKRLALRTLDAGTLFRLAWKKTLGAGKD